MKKKKAGILTFHDADNLGAVLQAFALRNVLKNECGISAEIIDYKCSAINKTKYAKKPETVKELIKYFPLSVYYYIKRRSFASFRREKLGCSERKFNKENIKNCENIYDFFITGSDQVWNPLCSDDDLTYVLDFVSDSNKKFSYAASIGNYEFKDSDSEWIDNIKKFKRISVRENYAALQLNKTGFSDISVNLDPVLLLSGEQWKCIMSDRLVKQRYVLVYLVLPDVNVLKQADEYAKKHNCKVISNKNSIEFFLHNSPAEFLSWIYHSECVFTNSFHGTAFSLIFNKHLFSDIQMTDGNINNRVNDLLIAADSTGCSVIKEDCDYCRASLNSNIEKLKEDSLAYLKRICDNV